jgi:hypothetical protein
MDALRPRRTRDAARKSWYAHYRQIRFARWLGFIDENADVNLLFRKTKAANGLIRTGTDGSDPSAPSPGLLLDESLSGVS